MSAIWFWLAKPIAEFLLVFAFIALIAMILLVLRVPGMIRKARCKHATVRETMACDAICNSCGKNLGFIGTWRQKNAKGLS